MPDRYEPSTFESKWQQRWKEADLFLTREEPGRKKFYGMDFFPYPSGSGLSVGHCKNYVPTDVICRMKFMQGCNVLHPMGFDAFGLPAENEAIKTKSDPAEMIERYAANYRRQMELIGISYDWSRSFASCDPTYYKWTQWIFELLYKRGLAYRKLAEVNWCPKDKTALANEEVVGGLCERCGTVVEKRSIPQWFFKITDYAQRLIDDLEAVDWPEGIKAQQRNWIGRSAGAQFSMSLATSTPNSSQPYDLASESNVERPLKFDVFTTRIDTIFGMTFCVLAPEHPLIGQIESRMDEERRQAIRLYRDQAKLLSDVARLATDRDKTGVFTGSFATNPANGKNIPIWIADYVMLGYGTGAIMAVPGHDARDFEFAQKFGLEIIQVISPENPASNCTLPFDAKDGVMINSGEYDGLSVSDCQKKLLDWLERTSIGAAKVQYKLRDWLISRQRYWGCPIPIIHSAEGETQLVAESDLPVYLPSIEHYEPSGDGSSPLAYNPEFVNVTDREGKLGRRETDTMGGFACSSWYFLRFCDPHNEDQAWSPDKANYWMPVDCYVGGAEHAVMHLLYARFWTKVLYDEELITVSEPFQKLENQGQVLALTPYRTARPGETLDVGEEGILTSFEEAGALPTSEVAWKWTRMSKSKGNVVTPDEAKEAYGADALRLHLLFVAPFEADVLWKNEEMQGTVRFLHRVFKFVENALPYFDPDWRGPIDFEELSEPAKEMRRATHKLIKKATEDIERFAFNTYVSAMMIFLKTAQDILGIRIPDRSLALALSEAVESLILVLSAGAPHSADELWSSIGNEGFTYLMPWPDYQEKLIEEDLITMAVQVNGKLRDTISLPKGADNATAELAALESSKVSPYLEGKAVRKIIFVPDKLVNIVAN